MRNPWCCDEYRGSIEVGSGSSIGGQLVCGAEKKKQIYDVGSDDTE